jgi:hypothetical protein
MYYAASVSSPDGGRARLGGDKAGAFINQVDLRQGSTIETRSL